MCLQSKPIAQIFLKGRSNLVSVQYIPPFILLILVDSANTITLLEKPLDRVLVVRKRRWAIRIARNASEITSLTSKFTIQFHEAIEIGFVGPLVRLGITCIVQTIA